MDVAIHVIMKLVFEHDFVLLGDLLEKENIEFRITIKKLLIIIEDKSYSQIQLYIYI